MNMLGIPVLSEYPAGMQAEAFYAQYQVVLDAIFGFSFAPPMREPFSTIIQDLNRCGIDIVSIDIPSGQDVERGDVTGDALRPKVLVSLTCPKLCARGFRGHHWLGGRFVPRAMQDEYHMALPPYPGSDPAVLLPPQTELP